ncbi:MAG: response regulator [Candidatus Latescibacteria bacterium]|nr:response regulator [Candidatus Latescibacterota bacterium]
MNKNGVLIIEDDREMCEELAEILKLEGYRVGQANDGIEGRRLFESGEYGLILLDLKLPGMSGSELLRYIKKNSSAMVMVITGKPLSGELREILKPDDREEKNALELADGLAEKPFNIEAVLKQIRKLIRRRPPAAGESGFREQRRDA